MKELAETLFKALADKPDAVVIEETVAGNVVHLKASVDESDKGKLIGKEGKVIKAVRVLLSARAAIENKRVYFDLQ